MLRVIRLHFGSPLHIHGNRADYATSAQFIHSDTIHAAVLQAWAMLGEEGWIESSQDFVCSSLFPFAKTNGEQCEYVYFFPRPIKVFDPESAKEFEQKSQIKVLKKIEWLDSSYFYEQLTAPKGAKLDEQHIFDKKYLTKEASNLNQFIYSQLEAKVKVSRNNKEDSTPYVFERVHFTNGAGLFFLIQAEDDTYNKLKKALDLLQYEGLGSDRNLGNGQFSYEEVDFNKLGLNDIETVESPFRTNLSLLLPEDKGSLESMLQSNDAAYQLIKRGGWITSESFLTLKKQSVFMLKEGAILKTNQSNTGKVIELTPEKSLKTHPIYRSGKSILFPICIEQS